MALPRFREMFEQGLVPYANQAEECMICRDDRDDQDNNTPQLVTMACSHFFCRPCIAKWLYKHATCPLCRTQLRRLTYDEACDAYVFQDETGEWLTTVEFVNWMQDARYLVPDNPPQVPEWLDSDVDFAINHARRNLLLRPYAGLASFGLLHPPEALPDDDELMLYLNWAQRWLHEGHPPANGPGLFPISGSIRAQLMVIGSTMSYQYTPRHLGPFQVMLNVLADIMDVCGERQVHRVEDMPAAIWSQLQHRLSVWDYTPGEATYFLDGNVVEFPSPVVGQEPLVRGGPLSQMRRNFDIVINFVLRFAAIWIDCSQTQTVRQ